MKRINKEDVRFDLNSYIDPIGRVFYLEGEIYRAFYPGTSEFYRELLASPAMAALIEQGKVVETVIEPELELDGFDLVVRHRRIPFPSYCFEWPMRMLKEAALLTLELAAIKCDRDITLQDSTPYNIYFDLDTPVFIDLGSFVPADKEEYIWGPYQQFCNFFLFPLYLYSRGYSDITRRLLANSIDGIAAADVAMILGSTDKLKTAGYMKRISIPEFFTGKVKKTHDRKKMTALSNRLSKRVDMRGMRARFFKSLRRDIEKIRIPDSGSHWSGYYEQTKDDVLKLKLDTVTRVLGELRPSTVLDIGCNVGLFSRAAASSGASVVAFDMDGDCINRLHGQTLSEGLNILPLIMNVLDPSPGMGWRGRQYSPAQERFKCDLVLALALIHHMVFTGGQDFDRAIQSIKDFQLKWLVIEFVDLSDPMAQLLARRPNIDYSWYTLDNLVKALGSHYKEVKILKRLSDTRTLLLAGL